MSVLKAAGFSRTREESLFERDQCSEELLSSLVSVRTRAPPMTPSQSAVGIANPHFKSQAPFLIPTTERFDCDDFRVPGTDPEVPGLIPGTSVFSVGRWVQNRAQLNLDTMNSNRSLRTLQPAANDKENLVGIGRMLPSSGKEKETIKVTKDLFEKTQKVNESFIDKHNAKNTGKTKKLSNKLIQTEEKKIIIEVEDLTSEGVYWQSLFLGAMFLAAGPSEKYWEVLAERRRVALEETLKENQKLHDTIALLKEECSEYKQLLKDSEDLVETLKELLGYEENETGDQDDSLLAN
uniref:(California timema) hypothetical protein n=1 Tax=Timema californicum TaxID=61474 RepID=A0A7R9J5K5_TIMCA|nr:unnamed protein product [Timema californicum]